MVMSLWPRFFGLLCMYGMVSVRLSVPSIDRCNSVRRVCRCGPGIGSRQEISIDYCTAGAQQQLRAVLRCQLAYEAEHTLV